MNEFFEKAIISHVAHMTESRKIVIEELKNWAKELSDHLDDQSKKDNNDCSKQKENSM